MEETKSWTLDDMSKDVLRQRNKVEDDTKQMSEDIVYYFKKIFSENKITKYTFKNNYLVALEGQRCMVRFLTYDEEKDIILVGFVLPNREVEITKCIKPLEQAKLFDYFVADFRSQAVFVVVEEFFDTETKVEILATFKFIADAKRFMNERIDAQRTTLNPQIWSENSSQSMTTDDHYYHTSRNYYYDIKIVAKRLL